MCGIITGTLHAGEKTNGHQTRSTSIQIAHITVIDGTGSKPRPDMTVVLSDGLVRYIGPSAAKTPLFASTTINGRGKFLLPGLIDTHAHVTHLRFVGTSSSRAAVYDDETSVASLRLLLAFGITTVRNPGGPTKEAVALRRRVASHEIDGPTVFTAGKILNHSTASDGLTREVENDGDVEHEVEAQVTAGVDFIKVYANMPPDLVASTIRAAHAHGLKVIGHLQATSWKKAAELGIDGICHGASWSTDELPPNRRETYIRAISAEGAMRARLEWLDAVEPDGVEIETMVQEISKRRIPIDPTLIAYATKFLGDSPRFLKSPDLKLAPSLIRSSFEESNFVHDWRSQDFAHGHQAWSKMQALILTYYRGGVLLTAGSDEPNSWIVPGPSLHTELQLLVEAGLSPMDVITIATRNGAESLGILSQTGTVSVGKQADLVIVDADPTQDIANTRRISFVIKGGRIFRQKDLLSHIPS
jgi:imidazolonepropionase-like amidohydrolase